MRIHRLIAVAGALQLGLTPRVVNAQTGTAPARVNLSPADTGTPISSAQAFKLSRGLFLNGQAGGADVHVTVPYGVAQIDLRAKVDWKGHVGLADLIVTYRDGSPSKRSTVFWSSTTVLVTLDGLEPAMKASGRAGVHFVAHRLDPNTTTLDRVLSFMSHLASDRGENPVTLRQSGVRWLGAKSRDGVTGDVYEGAKQTRYWLEPASNRLLRVEARLQGTAAVAVFDITRPGPRTITAPALAEIVKLEDIPDVYAQLNPK